MGQARADTKGLAGLPFNIVELYASAHVPGITDLSPVDAGCHLGLCPTHAQHRSKYG